MKVRTFIPLVLFFLIATTATGLAETVYKLTTYSNRVEGFRVDLPDTWESREGFMGTKVIALSPQEGSSDTFRENVNVVTEQLQFPMTEKEYTQASLSAMEKFLTDFQLEKRGVFEADKGKISYFIYSHRQGVFRLKVLAGLAVSGSRGYAVSFTAPVETFAKWKPTFERILLTFHLTP